MTNTMPWLLFSWERDAVLIVNIKHYRWLVIHPCGYDCRKNSCPSAMYLQPVVSNSLFCSSYLSLAHHKVNSAAYLNMQFITDSLKIKRFPPSHKYNVPSEKKKIVDYVRIKSWREILPRYMSENIHLPTQLTQCYNFCNIQRNTIVCECIVS